LNTSCQGINADAAGVAHYTESVPSGQRLSYCGARRLSRPNDSPTFQHVQALAEEPLELVFPTRTPISAHQQVSDTRPSEWYHGARVAAPAPRGRRQAASNVRLRSEWRYPGRMFSPTLLKAEQ
jgi:hypothetical protein